jgi:hypothetical protein
MNIREIKAYFNGLTNDVKRVSNKGTLKFYKTRAMNYRDRFSFSGVDSRIKREVNRGYKRVIETINSMRKKL